VHAHIELLVPLPIASKCDPQNTPANIDYNLVRPLLADGTDFPCHNHSGGSCQISLSYDNGMTFKVIKPIMGNCPIQIELQHARQRPNGSRRPHRLDLAQQDQQP
jgi:hypothetical protein